jgi:hypothetical protein
VGTAFRFAGQIAFVSACVAIDAAYRPRNPEESPLYKVVAGHLEMFLARQRERDRQVPAFAEREFRSFIDCGVLARGFVRVHCDDCGLDRFVPYSCKKRGFCNSCGGRRMSETAAHLVDSVFPHVPVRQWVLSFPHALRYRLAYDADMVTDVLRIFTKTVFASLIRRAREFGAVRKAQCGAVTFIQRFGSALNCNIHLHTMMLDGVYAADEDGHPQFQALPAPEDREIEQLAAALAERISKFLLRRGLGPDSNPEEADPLSRDQPWLARLYAASVSGRVAFGRNAGRRGTRVGDQIDPESMQALASPRCATVAGFSLHANTAVPAGDRQRLQRLAQYCARPPVAMERLELLPGGRLLYRFKRPWNDGTTHVILEPLELMEKLVAIVPAPRAHQLRYAGILAPAAKWRALIVPAGAAAECPHAEDLQPVPEVPHRATKPASKSATSPEPAATPSQDSRHGPNYAWAELMKRVWSLDVLECPRCMGRMKIVAAIHHPDAARKILECVGLPSRAPPVAPAASNRHAESDWS